MKKAFILFLILLLATPVFATIAATIEWEVRTTGNDNNGGGFKPGASGTDWSQQDSPQYALTGLTTSGTSTTIATTSSSADMVGNIIQITGGTNFIAGFYEIVSESLGVSITLDRNCTTGIGAAGTGNIGGGLTTIQKGNDAAINSNTVWIKAGTYTQTTPIAFSNIGTAAAPKAFRGYNTSHGDSTTRPLITTATNTTILCKASSCSGIMWRNINFSNTAGTSARGFSDATDYAFWLTWAGCKFTGFTEAVELDFIIDFGEASIQFNSCEFTSCSSACLKLTGTSVVRGCYLHDCTGDGIFLDGPAAVGSCTVMSSVFYQVNHGINTDSGTDTRANNFMIVIEHSDFVSSVSDDILIQNTTRSLNVTNSIGYNNGTGGSGKFINCPNMMPSIWANYNAYASGDLTNVTAGASDVTITGDPFTAKGSADFSLNNTAGAGTACRNAGFPSATGPGLFGAGYEDIGALRHQDAGGASVQKGFIWGG